MAMTTSRLSALFLALFLSSGCMETPEDKIAAKLKEDPAVLEFGWEVSEVRHADGQYYAYLDLPPEYDASRRLPQETEKTVRGLCPAGEDTAGGEFWEGEDRFDEFRLVATSSRGNVVARVDCARDFDRVEHLLR